LRFYVGNRANAVSPKLGKDPVKKVIAAMTLEEKAALVVGTGMRMPGGPPPSPDGKPSAFLHSCSFGPCNRRNSEPGCRQQVHPIALPRLGITLWW